MLRRAATFAVASLLLVTIGIVGAPTARAHGQIDQDNYCDFVDSYHSLVVFYPVGQTFVPRADNLAGLDLALIDGDEGDYAYSTILVEVWRGYIGDTLVGGTRILLPDGFQHSGEMYAHIHFDPPVPLVPGVLHSLKVYVNPDEVGPGRGNWLVGQVYKPGGGTYPAGEMIFMGVPMHNNDLCFRTWSAPPEEAVGVDCDPNTINLRAKGRWVVCYLEPESGRAASEIEGVTVRLDSWMAPVLDGRQGFSFDPGGYLVDHDHDGVAERLVKFDRQALAGSLAPGVHRFLIQGTFSDGTGFRGESDLIRVIA